MRPALKPLIQTVTTLFILIIHGAAFPANSSPIDPFVGRWVGIGLTEKNGPASNQAIVDRELDVTIRLKENGFSIVWQTVRRPANAGNKKFRAWTSVVPFVQTERKGLYRMDVSGEPVSGSPYVWAFVSDRVLTVHRISISSKGVLEYQKYVRTLLADNEMQLHYTRSLDGNQDRSVLARLRKK